LAEELVCKDAGLGEAVNGFPNFNENVSLLGVGVEVVLCAGVEREDRNWHLHIFETVHRGTQIKVLNVEAEIFSPWCADDTVPKHFCSGEISRPGGQFARVMNEITTGSQSNTVGIFLLWSVIDNDTCVGYHAIGRNLSDFVVCENVN